MRSHARVLIYCASLLFWLVSLLNLNRAPVIHQDEPWILSPGYKLFTQGIYGSDLFTGFHGMEHHYLQFMPLMSVLEGICTRTAGVGLIQLRFIPVALGVVMLALVYRLGRQVASSQAAAVAVLLLLTWQWTGGGGRALGTGILLVDLARIARYDLLAAVLGLAGFAVYLAARRRSRPPLYFCAGLLIGLAGLAHPYGLMWLGPVAVLEVTAVRRGLLFLGAGTLVVWLPWLLFVASNWGDYVGQVYHDRALFSVFDPGFYFSNLISEPQRYHFDPSLGGPWLLLAGVPLAWLWLVLDSIHNKKGQGLALAAAAFVLPLLFGLLLAHKTINYLLTIVPLVSLVLGAGLERLLTSRAILSRAGAALLLLGIAGQGTLAIVQMQQRAAQMEPAEAELGRLRSIIPEGARVLGHPQYALAFDLADYRSFVLPFYFSDPDDDREPISLYAALERIAPDYILYDPAIDAVFADRSTALHNAWNNDFQHFLQAHHAQVVGTVFDQEHNSIRIYRLSTHL